jgi:hypothetical protein
MKPEVLSKRAAAFIGAFVPAALLIVSLNAQWAVAGGQMHSQPPRHDGAHPCLLASVSFQDGIDSRVPHNPWVSKMMSSAISIANNL